MPITATADDTGERVMARPTVEQYEKWNRQLFNLLGEVEAAHGDNAAGTYPSALEMALWFAQREAARARRGAEHAAATAACQEAMR